MTDAYQPSGGARPSDETVVAPQRGVTRHARDEDNETVMRAPAAGGDADGEEDAADAHDGADDAEAGAGRTPRAARPARKRIAELVRQREAAARERDYWRRLALDRGAPPLMRDAPPAEPAATDSSRQPPTDMPSAGTPPPHAGVPVRALQAAWAEFDRRADAARARHADFDAVALDPSLPFTDAMAAAVLGAANGPDIAYHLGRNPDEAWRIARLDPLSAAREIGRIGAMTAPPGRRVTGAPEPVRPVDGGETPQRDPGAMSYAEYRRWRLGK